MIDLALSTAELSLLTLWEILEEYPALSDHELIVLHWENIYQNVTKFSTSRITGWNIQNLIENKDQLIIAKAEWEVKSQNQPILQNQCLKKNLDQEVEWVEYTLTMIPNKNCKLMRVIYYSKRWWNKEVKTAHKSWAKEKKDLAKNYAR